VPVGGGRVDPGVALALKTLMQRSVSWRASRSGASMKRFGEMARHAQIPPADDDCDGIAVRAVARRRFELLKVRR